MYLLLPVSSSIISVLPDGCIDISLSEVSAVAVSVAGLVTALITVGETSA